MKRVLLFILLSCLSFAQPLIQSSAKGLSGQVLYTSNTAGTEHATALDICPGGFVFISDQIEIGLSLTYHRYNEDEITLTSVGAGPSVTVYLMKEGNALPFLGAGFAYLENTLTADYPYMVYNSMTTVARELNLTAGLLIPISRSVALIPMLHHKWVGSKKSGLNDYKQFMVGIGLRTFLN